jgi:hypothetical protein
MKLLFCCCRRRPVESDPPSRTISKSTSIPLATPSLPDGKYLRTIAPKIGAQLPEPAVKKVFTPKQAEEMVPSDHGDMVEARSFPVKLARDISTAVEEIIVKYRDHMVEGQLEVSQVPHLGAADIVRWLSDKNLIDMNHACVGPLRKALSATIRVSGKDIQWKLAYDLKAIYKHIHAALASILILPDAKLEDKTIVFFVDVDGVLLPVNSALTDKKLADIEALLGRAPTLAESRRFLARFINTEALILLRQLAEDHQAKIVFSSHWRIESSIQLLQEFFDPPKSGQGLGKFIIGKTKEETPLEPPKRDEPNLSRGQEIEAWLKEHHPRGLEAQILVFDDTLAYLLGDKFPKCYVHCNSKTGLGMMDFQQANILLRPS